MTAALLERFRASHDVQLIDAVPRNIDAYPAVAHLKPAQRARVLDECRGGPMQWLVAWSKAGRGARG